MPIFTAAISESLAKHFQLRAQCRLGVFCTAVHALGVLHRERGDGRDAVTSVCRESFQVRRYARAADWIESRDRQQKSAERCWND